MWRPKYHPRGEVNAVCYGWKSPWLKGDVRPVLPTKQVSAVEHQEDAGKAPTQLAGVTGLILPTQPTSTAEHVPMEQATPIGSIKIVHSVVPSEHRSEDEHDTVEGAIPAQSAEDVLPVGDRRKELSTQHTSEYEHEIENEPTAVQDAHGLSRWKRLRDYFCF